MIKKKKLTTKKFQELTETSLWWKEISDEMDRVYRVQSFDVPIEHKVVAIHALLENQFITDKKIEEASKDNVFQEAYEILAKTKVGDSFPEKIYELGKVKLPEVKETVSKISLQIIGILSKTISQEKAKNLWENDKEKFYTTDFAELSKLLELETSTDRYILRCLESLTYYYLYFSQTEYDPFEGEKVFSEATVDNSKYKRASYLAYRVFNPLWDKRLYRFEPGYVKFPLKWAGTFLPMGFSERLYNLYKDGKDVSSVFVSYYKNEERVQRLKDAIKNCPHTVMFSEVFDEAVDSYERKNYKVSSVTFLSIIEGLIWEFAWEWNQIHGNLFSVIITKEQFYDTNTFELLKPDNSRIGGRPNIGKLLRQTLFGEELYVEMIEYLCEELFDERNAVLHGRKPDYGNSKKASTLLLVIETIERAITAQIKEELGKIVKEKLIINPS